MRTEQIGKGKLELTKVATPEPALIESKSSASLTDVQRGRLTKPPHVVVACAVKHVHHRRLG